MPVARAGQDATRWVRQPRRASSTSHGTARYGCVNLAVPVARAGMTRRVGCVNLAVPVALAMARRGMGASTSPCQLHSRYDATRWVRQPRRASSTSHGTARYGCVNLAVPVALAMARRGMGASTSPCQLHSRYDATRWVRQPRRASSTSHGTARYGCVNLAVPVAQPV